MADEGTSFGLHTHHVSKANGLATRSLEQHKRSKLDKCEQPRMINMWRYVWYFHVASHASPFNHGGSGASPRHDLGPGQLPGGFPTCHCQVQHQVGHTCQARRWSGEELHAAVIQLHGWSEKVDGLEKIFLEALTLVKYQYQPLNKTQARLWLYGHTLRVLTHTHTQKQTHTHTHQVFRVRMFSRHLSPFSDNFCFISWQEISPHPPFIACGPQASAV